MIRIASHTSAGPTKDASSQFGLMRLTYSAHLLNSIIAVSITHIPWQNE